MRRFRSILSIVALGLVLGPTLAQGPGSCGFHLDALANFTSTHAAIADAPGAPGSGFAGYPAGVPGNPYTAYALPGTSVLLRLSIPPSTLGPGPFGAGSLVSLFWAVGTPNIPVGPGPAFIPACVPGQPLIISVVPFGGTLVDGLGVTGPPPVIVPADPGHPSKLEVNVVFPAGIPVGLPILVQALVLTPTGLFGVSNAVSLLAGPNPFEFSVLGGLIPTGASPALDEGFAPIPPPPGFMFYGVPVPVAEVSTNGFVDFLPGPTGSDFSGTVGDLGCAPATATASPRLAVNHFDINFAIPALAPWITDLSFEAAPPGPGWPSRTIVRWKNVANFGVPVGLLDQNRASMVAELWGMDGPNGSRMVVVRQEMHTVTTIASHDMVGIGNGIAGQGYFGPPLPCTALVLPGLYGTPGYFSLPGEAIYMDNTPTASLVGSYVLSNLAVVFDPLLGAVPTPYAVTVY